MPDVEDRQNIRVVQGCSGASFLFESISTVSVTRDGGGEHLDGDVTPKPRIPRPINLAHRPGADECNNLVRPESGARCQ
jgi:hypothetical protein